MEDLAKMRSTSVSTPLVAVGPREHLCSRISFLQDSNGTILTLPFLLLPQA